MDEITIDDFFKVDLRIAKVVEVSEIEEADKLVQLKLDLGELGEKTVFAGIKKYYEPENLINKMVVCVNNLKPRRSTHPRHTLDTPSTPIDCRFDLPEARYPVTTASKPV